jgi:predicted DNA-binding protein
MYYEMYYDVFSLENRQKGAYMSYSVTITFRINTAMHNKLKALAKSQKRNQSDTVRQAVEDAIERNQLTNSLKIMDKTK